MTSQKATTHVSGREIPLPQLVKMLGSAIDTRVDPVGLQQAAQEVRARLER